MAQWLKTLTTKPEDLSLSPGTHFYMCHGTCAHTHTHTGAGREAEIKGFNAQKSYFQEYKLSRSLHFVCMGHIHSYGVHAASRL